MEGAAFFQVGSFVGAQGLQGGEKAILSAGLHGVVGGAFSEIQGGNFLSGFLAAGVSDLAGPFELKGDIYLPYNAAVHAAAGGFGSILGGGKFANGAVTGAFGYLFNKGAHDLLVAPKVGPISQTQANRLIRRVSYDKNGSSQLQNALRRPWDALVADGDASQARIDAEVRVAGSGNQSGHNDSRDAFRHADWAIRMSRDIGDEAAQSFGDAHERIETTQPLGELLMDLVNNYNGRVLSHMYPQILPPDLADQALRAGQLQKSPIEVQ